MFGVVMISRGDFCGVGDVALSLGRGTRKNSGYATCSST
jgi:hypothetical protein